jgi:excisionase family DNA binding protein
VSSNVIALTGRTARERAGRQSNQSPAAVVSIGSCAVYTVAEVAALLSLSRGSAYQLVRTGEIPSLKLGGRWVIPKRRFHNWLDNLTDASESDHGRDLRPTDTGPHRLNRSS